MQALFGHVLLLRVLNDAYAARKLSLAGYALPDGTLLYQTVVWSWDTSPD